MGGLRRNGPPSKFNMATHRARVAGGDEEIPTRSRRTLAAARKWDPKTRSCSTVRSVLSEEERARRRASRSEAASQRTRQRKTDKQLEQIRADLASSRLPPVEAVNLAQLSAHVLLPICEYCDLQSIRNLRCCSAWARGVASACSSNGLTEFLKRRSEASNAHREDEFSVAVRWIWYWTL